MADAPMTPEGRLLKETAEKTEQAAQDALTWLKTPKNAERVGDDVDDKRRELHLGVKLARRFAKAAQRPMAVAVFGPSQAGKSHLIHTLSRRDGRLLTHFDGEEPINYITRINAEKQDRESTGLVTRFSVREDTTPPGFPVHLRLLDHADIIKIIANAYCLDGEPDRFETPPTPDEIREHLDRFRAIAGAKSNNGLDAADIWDIEAYVQDNLGHCGVVKALRSSDFWALAADKVEQMQIDDVANLFAILWGGHQALVALHTKLAQALQRLDFASDVYVPFAAIDLNVSGVTSILDVDSLDHLIGEETATIVVQTEKGIEATLPRAVTTAITAELHIRMIDPPWRFFNHTDLLDFPGYRARGLTTSETDEAAAQERSGLGFKLQDAPAQTIGALLRRGKVEFLFQRYVAEREITAMLLCIREGNFETKSISQAIAKWIGTTHGSSADDRRGKDTLLFFVLTRFDNHFDDGTTDNIAQQIKGRIQESIYKGFGGSETGWVKNWAGGDPFRNVFMMRKPGMPTKTVIYEISGTKETGLKETGILSGADKLLARLREAFLSVPEVKEHFAEPARAFDELAKVDDGGASYLAEKLELVCRPEIKPAQVRMNIKELRSQLSRLLTPAYYSPDLNARLTERMDVAEQIIGDLYACAQAGRIGTLIQGLMIDAGVMSDYLYRGEADEAEEEPALVPASPGFEISLPGMVNAPAQPQHMAPARNVYQKMAGIALKSWFDLLHERTRNMAFCAETHMQPKNLREMADEYVQAARRQHLVDRIAEQIKHYAYDVERHDLRREKAAMVAVQHINRFVYDFGYSARPENERPRIQSRGAAPERVAFAEPPVAYDVSGIEAVPKPYRVMLSEDWMYGFYQTVQDNARSVDGVDVDLVENEKLGIILNKLETLPGEELKS